MPERNITFEIKEHLGTIAKYESGWNKELNVISWNGAPAKYDVRDWDEIHARMSRGITLNPWEMRKLVDLYLTRNSERAVARGKAIEAERNKRREDAFKPNQLPEEMVERQEENLPATDGAEAPEAEEPFVPVGTEEQETLSEAEQEMAEEKKEETPF